MLIRLPRPRFVLLQTPPCAPSFTVCRLVSFLRGATFIIDWHNFAYTLMGLKLGETHFLVRLAKRYERVACAGAHKHICVTSAMREWLREEWNVENATVLHDKPPAFFQPSISAPEAHDLFLRLEPILDASDARHPDDLKTRDAFCFGDDHGARRRKKKDVTAASTPITTRFPDRDVIGADLHTSTRLAALARAVGPSVRAGQRTSWTPDEDRGVAAALEGIRRGGDARDFVAHRV